MGAGADIFKLYGYVVVQDIDKAFKQLDKLANSASDLSKVLNKAAKQVNELGLKLSRSLTAPIAVVGTAVGALALKTGDYADQLLSLEQSTGLTTDTLQEFAHVAKTAGGSSDALFSSLTALTGKLPDIASGTGDVSKAFSDLGVNVLNADGSYRGMEDILPEVISGLQGIDDITTRNILAQDIFGKKTKEIAAILGMTSGEMANLRKEAHALGMVTSNEGLKSANDFRIGVENLKGQVAALGRDIAVSLMPILNETLIPLIQTTIVPALNTFADAVQGVAGAFALLPQAIQGTVIVVGALVAALGPLLLITAKLIKEFKAAILVITPLNKAMIALKGSFIGAHASMLKYAEMLPIIGKSTAAASVAATAGLAALTAAAGWAVGKMVELAGAIRDYWDASKSLKETKKRTDEMIELNNATKEQIKKVKELKALEGTVGFDLAKLEQAPKAAEDAAVAAANHARAQAGLAKMNAEEEETRRKALRANLEGRKAVNTAATEGKRLTEYEMAQLKKKQEEEAKAAEDRAKRNAEELRKRKQELSDLLTAHDEAYNKMGKTEMELLYMEEQEDLQKAQQLGATDAQLESILRHYDAMRQEMIEKDAAYWEEQGREADKYLEERRQTEMKYAADLNEAKRNIALEGMKRDADEAESTLRDTHRAEMAEIQKRGGDVKAAQIAHDVEMRTLQVSNAKQIAMAEFDAKKEAMQSQYAAEIEEAEKAFTDTNAIRERYGVEFDNLEQQRVAAAKSADAELTEITREGNAARSALNKQYVQGFVSGMISAVNQLGSVLAAFSANDEKRVDRNYNKRKESIEANVSDEEERARQLAALDEEYETKKLTIQREQAKREKALGIFNTVINTAQAIVKALADLGPIAGPIMAGVVGALGVAQTVAIASTPEPFEAGALIQGGRGGVHGLVGEGRQDELILPMDTGIDRLADRLLSALNPVVSDNRSSSVSINVGTLIGDDRGIKELARRMRPHIAYENKRTGAAGV